MHLSELLETSLIIYRRHRVILYLSAILSAMHAVNLLDSVIMRQNGFLFCGYQVVSLLASFAYYFSEVGFIHTVYTHQVGQTSTLKEIWGIFRSRFGPLFLLSFIFVGIFIVLFFALFLIVVLLTYDQTNDLRNTSFLIIQLTIVILSPFLLAMGYANRSIIVERSGSLASIKRGFHVLRKNLGITLLIFGINLALHQLLLLFASFLYFDIVPSSTFNLLTDPFYLSYAKLITSPASTVIQILLSFVLSPLYSICLTLIYMRSTPQEFLRDVKVQYASS